MYFFVPQESSLLMSLFPNQREESSRYKVSVVDPNDKKVDSLTQPASRGRKAYRSIVHKVVNVMMTLMLAFLGLFAAIGTAAPANASFVGDGFKGAFCGTGLFNYELETRRWGPTTGNESTYNATPYEKYGTAGLQWTVWLGAENPDGLNKEGEFGGTTISNYTNQGVDHIDDEIDGEEWKKYRGFYNVDQTCVPVMNVGATAIANMIMTSTSELVHITNLIYQVAYESSANILGSVEEPIKTIVTTMRDAVFFAFLTPIIMLGALWMAWVGLVKRSSIQAAQGAGWMILAAVASVALMSNPMWLPKTINTVVSTVSEAGMTAVTSTTSNGAGEICTVAKGASQPDDLIPGKTGKYVPPSNDTTRQVVRQMQCTMWYSFMYTPWMLGQFGDSPAEIDENHLAKKGFTNGASTVGGQTPIHNTPINFVKLGENGQEAPIGAQSWALFHLDNKIAYPGITAEEEQQQRNSLINVALSQLHHEDYNKVYRGDDSMNRIATATIGLIAALGAGIMIIIVSMSIIILDVGLIILTLVSPLFFLVGVHPGFGRRIALGWLETIIGLAMKRVVLSMLLAVMLVFYATILSANASMPWLVSMILVIAVSIGGISYKDQILNMFNKISLGGDGGVQPQNMPGAERAKSAGMSMAKNAASMAIAGKVMNRGNANGNTSINNRGKTTGSGDGSGAGKRKEAPLTARQKAEEAMKNKHNAGAGAKPNDVENKRKKDKPSDATNTDTAAAAGVGAGAGARTVPNGNTDPNATKGVGGNKENASGAGPEARRVEEAEEAAQLGGAGHYTGPDGRVVDAEGNAVPLDRLSDEERAVMDQGGAGKRIEDANGGAVITDDMSPSERAIATMRASSPKAIKARAEAEAKRITDRDRLLPTQRPTNELRSTAMKQNKAVDKEKKRLEAKMPGTTVSHSRALASVKEKEKAAELARAKRNASKDKLVQKKRDLVTSTKSVTNTVVGKPMNELRTMAGAADKQYAKGYVKKTVVGASRLPGKAGTAVVSAADRKIENTASRALYRAELEAKTWEIRANNFKDKRASNKDKRAFNKEQAHIPKRYRETERPAEKRQVEQPVRQPRRVEPPEKRG